MTGHSTRTRAAMPQDVPEVKTIIERLCALQEEVVHDVLGYAEPNDCFCGEGGFWPLHRTEDFRTSFQAIDFIEAATRKAIKESRHVS
jgi:hypothetical protein